MTDQEKKDHPDAYVCDGYLKTISYKTAWRKSWDKADNADRNRLFELPNFDPDIFEEISGIHTHDMWEEFKK